MAQFDVYRLRAGNGPVVDIQSDLLKHFKTRLVIPLLPIEMFEPEAPKLNPIFVIAGESLVLAPQGIGTVLLRELGEQITSLGDRYHQVSSAVDFLVNGY